MLPDGYLFLWSMLSLPCYITHGHGSGNPGLLDRLIFVLVAYPTCKVFWNRPVFFVAQHIYIKRVSSCYHCVGSCENFGAAFPSRPAPIKDIRLASSTACSRPAKPLLHRSSALTQAPNSGKHTWPPYENDLISGIGSLITTLVQLVLSGCLLLTRRQRT